MLASWHQTCDHGPFGFHLRELPAVRSLYFSNKPFNCIFVTMGGGGKIPYPKEVWSPSGGWYAQPANWRANTAIMGAFVIGVAAVAFSISADREYRDKMPEPGRFFPSRYWSRQIREHEQQQAAKNDS
ncbi:unnamed protein product [Penicillium nalgiovense]|uniref:Uncharacterized protein n=9 Tax=Penicillium TaxID=5073 RepID=A0A1V6XEG5_PENNA|nr:hypothetical protein PENNAL_c0086G00740 [Penicillium nalgiovense]CAG7947309.1 unnamed protein product [Penicillium nalgiovense]CAG7948494.1 unnamed protein product [Penicillium nalgiovense]CAG7949520.1 unnamed protein product [Penicillium nalgiovense]CAG7980020.1 unnamed protein product [Penicillium nalgiovense]